MWHTMILVFRFPEISSEGPYFLFKCNQVNRHFISVQVISCRIPGGFCHRQWNSLQIPPWRWVQSLREPLLRLEAVNPLIQDKIKGLTSTDFTTDCSADQVELFANRVRVIFIQVADLSLKKKTRPFSGKKKHKSWFNASLVVQRERINELSKLLSFTPYNHSMRCLLFKCMREYNGH
jgi:hypothetical protein